MEIRIRYKLRAEGTKQVLELSPEDYFDPLGSGESLSVRSVPRLLDTFQYTPHTADELCWTVVEIIDGPARWRVRTQLIDGMRTLMHHSEESDGSEEIVHQTELNAQCWHTIRTSRAAGKTWTVVMNTLTLERPVHLAADRDFCELWSFEELKSFGVAF